MRQKVDYELLGEQAKSLVAGETDWISNTANLAALLFHSLNVNFAGVYRYENQELILGPFQGNVACVHIAVGKGVCGKCAAEQKSVIVPDVHQFSGHIACDSATNSELVVPIFNPEGQFWGVFDFDCLDFNGFDAEDEKHLNQISQLIFGQGK
ncbi:GAF domain-containing protein [Lactobacillus corticis]|uniref:GAF domain-containing protein n=1 Tax=Lactobacillus corticis TaxID=2201249 RepID=A0A916VI02_9LACO|nr:GAF domain-containing protein [Lactobacillus corticis]GFZ26818.1 GAF domain-containing protein [Lactobacillus corticis]